MSQYPRDEFDKVPETSARQGVHRERLIPSRSNGLGLLITVGVLALLIGLAAYFVLPRLGIGSGSAGPSPEAQASAPASASASAAATPTPEAKAEDASPSPAPASTPTPTPTPTPTAPAIDRTQPVAVFNASGVTGLGAGVSGRMSAAGWAVGTVANWAGAPQQGSGVYYSSPELAANAQEIGAQLGIPALETPGFTSVTVILGPGYR
ncbi:MULTISPECIES: LytR C-terminal domain-containing protein [unclassified Arthrobacter]|uniref:LytR C-terminal domain-containing protein n=1 Tax=unclassified Arthrobacter TaxID=235627 RepID=UPI00210730E9|nr:MULTISPECIES: LytR C-terminal domain-containing protein [unclassified Arthrobacter]MCQ1947450.1 LytR C-terminal domain-containing protein [Arthrobacter sp. zg-Y1116]MCQ1987402.1 LytR C-terminal domain-containing protein [Arthrobacter sp. zg-Y844]MCQ1996746.1 LytR C-terminal domain-containing protein [Arthrobacter sp. zg-Y1171]UWX82343.1 LytR C-terminal domain-containing protein [Arthrobacter sp. zg-Y1171]